MNLIIETDIGHDPDDFFAICYLVAIGVQISAITVTPGDPDQIAIARFLCDELGLHIPVGASKLGQTKLSSGSIHHVMLKRYGRSLSAPPNGLGAEIIKAVKTDDTELFAIGPLSSVGQYLRAGGKPFAAATMQGGFVPYSFYRPQITLDKFEGKDWIPTFNLNGDRKGAEAFLSAAMPRRIVGKAVCHTVEFTRERFARFAPPPNRAAELFCEAANIYFEGHSAKKLHDPTAAVCMIHPEVGLWAEGKPTKQEGGWTTRPGEDQVLVDLDHEAMWGHLESWT
jgi:inosine-uridine nucleoside N-ribohydrolase